MLNQRDMLEIMKRLHIDAETEMTGDDLERMLDEELSKPEEQMDAELVRELVLLLKDGVTEQERENAWRATEKQLPGKGQPAAVRWLVRLAATVVVVLGLTVLTYKTAEAFNWQQLLRLMRPFAETFMLYAGEQPGDASLLVDAYGDCGKVDDPCQYASLADAPEFLQGYPARPYGMPERFAYLQGASYSDDLNATITHIYIGDGGVCTFTLLILNGDEQTTSHQYERTMAETKETYIAGCLVTYYLNSDDATMSASWTQDKAQYSIFGVIDEAELAWIVEATMSR